MGKSQPGKYGLDRDHLDPYGRQSDLLCQETNFCMKAPNSNVSKHASKPSAEMDSKKRIESELGLLHARKAVASDPSQGNLKKVKKAPMKKAFKTKKLKKLSRAQIVADKEEKKLSKQEQKLEKKKIRKAVWD
ncbi:hypothetical protein INT43_002108 [Umbelopsis isabellina]|uniref:Uncharacterized protein n=1 Tax=Mortierella isabellina TaxID=91625 RepID=A0A8H7UGQ4_MORIS|nr:hypothetical protein INT43_002108 [Umbelopsis isabellina]